MAKKKPKNAAKPKAKPKSKPKAKPKKPEKRISARKPLKVKTPKRRKRIVKIQPDVELQLVQIDPAPAYAVRGAVDDETVRRYAESYKAGDVLPPVDVFTGGDGHYLLADGGNRYKARSLAGFQSIICRLHVCESAEYAEEEAALYAAGSNEKHGKQRSNEDRRAAVKSIIARAKYASASDREVAKICNVHHPLVRLIREQLTAAGKLEGPAAATARDYKPEAELRRGMVTDGKGGLVPKKASGKQLEFPPAEEQAPEPTRSKRAEPADEQEAEPVKSGRATGKTATDAKGRPVPDRLLAIFAEVPLFARVAGSIRAAVKEIQDRETDPVFACVSINNVLTDLDNLTGSIESARPYVVCPACSGTGQKLPAGPKRPDCGTCAARGWISKGGWTRLTADQKEVAGGYEKRGKGAA